MSVTLMSVIGMAAAPSLGRKVDAARHSVNFGSMPECKMRWLFNLSAGRETV
jgi:hypothetical protein